MFTARQTVRLSDCRGRLVLIFFTTTWCPYCSAEAPYLEHEIWQRYRALGLQVFSIQVKEGAELAGSFAERFEWTFPAFVDEDGSVSEGFAPVKEGLPPEVAIVNAHFVLDADGKVAYRDFLNMERFDAKAIHSRAFLDDMLGAEMIGPVEQTTWSAPTVRLQPRCLAPGGFGQIEVPSAATSRPATPASRS